MILLVSSTFRHSNQWSVEKAASRRESDADLSDQNQLDDQLAGKFQRCHEIVR